MDLFPFTLFSASLSPTHPFLRLPLRLVSKSRIKKFSLPAEVYVGVDFKIRSLVIGSCHVTF